MADVCWVHLVYCIIQFRCLSVYSLPVELSNEHSGVLKSPIISALGLICFLKSCKTVFMKFSAPGFDLFISMIVVCSWLIVPLIRIKWSSSSFLISFSSKSILSDIRIATPACFLVPFAWNIFSTLSPEDSAYPGRWDEFLVDKKRWILFLNPFC